MSGVSTPPTGRASKHDDDIEKLEMDDSAELDELLYDGGGERGSRGFALSASYWVTNDDITALGHLPVIDGLRGLALLGPMMDHIATLNPWNIMVGSMGVSVFFVLSGFLITGVLLKMHRDFDTAQRRGKPRSIDWRRYLSRFYMDRLVRLGPALVLVTLWASWVAWRRHPALLDDVISNALRSLLSIINTPFLAPRKLDTFLPHTWSLACEEQFYLVWSLALPFIALLKTRGRACVLGGLIVASAGARLYAAQGQHHWLLTWNRSLISAALYKMLMGASLRLIPFPRSLARPRTAYVGLGLFLVCPLLALRSERPTEGVNHLGSFVLDLVLCVATMLIIVGTLFDAPRVFLLKLPSLLGRISYAAYLWTVVLISANASMFKGYNALTDSALGLWVAVASTLWIEEPARRYYRKVRGGS